MTITDANGLNRFKNGIFVDTFNDFSKSDVSNPEYSLAINGVQARGRPRIIREIIDIDFNSAASTGVQKTGRLVTLPYTEVSHIAQPYATKYRSSAHVSLAWNGSLKLIPEYDNHNDVKNTGSINITVDLTTPWKEFAKGPFGSIWGDWTTQTEVTSKTVRTGETKYVEKVDLGGIGLFRSATAANQAALNEIHARYGQNVVVGNLNLRYVSDIRLKKDISLLGKLFNGLNLYRYRYLWSDTFYVGVMAQEVEKIMPDAVIYDSRGYMAVNYGKIGIPMLTWDQLLQKIKFAA